MPKTSKHAAARRDVSAGQLRHLLAQLQDLDFDALQHYFVTHGDPLKPFERKNPVRLQRTLDHEVYEKILSNVPEVYDLLGPKPDPTDQEQVREMARSIAQHIPGFILDYSFTLQPPIPGLAGRCHQSVFWRAGNISGIRVVTPYEIRPAMRDQEHPVAKLMRQLNDEFRELDYDLHRHFQPANQLQRIIDERIDEMFGDWEDGSSSSIAEEIDRLCPGRKTGDWREHLGSICRNQLFACVRSMVLLGLQERRMHQWMMRSLTALFLEGNIPLGFDEADRLVLICADD